MGMAMAERTWGRALVAALCVAALAFAGCGGGDEDAPEPDAPAAESAPSPRPSPRPRRPRQPSREAQELKKPAKPETLRLVEDGNPTVFVKIKETVDLYDEPDGKVVETVGHSTAIRLAHRLRGHRPEGRLGRRPHALSPRTASRSGSSWTRSASRRVARSGTSRWICPSSRRDSLKTASSCGPSPSRSGCRPRRRRPAASRSPTQFRGGLNEAYGCCALATTARQINLPSGWLGGDRIAFHGTSGEIGAEISHGCIRAADEDVSAWSTWSRRAPRSRSITERCLARCLAPSALSPRAAFASALCPLRFGGVRR